MGMKIFNGRYTADSSESSFVIFIIGMRLNQIYKIWKWIPVLNSMGPMIKELYQNPQWGFLHTEVLFGWRKITLIQYWKEFDGLIDYAHGKNHDSLGNHIIGKLIITVVLVSFTKLTKLKREHQNPSMLNMPKTGLSQAMTHIPISQSKDSANKRMGNARREKDPK